MTHYKTDINEFHVSTIAPWNGRQWETCIFKGHDSIVVAWYSNEEKAREGHAEWVKKIEDNPEFQLPYPEDIYG